MKLPLLSILFFCSTALSLDLNEIKRMKTDPTTIATTTTTVTTTTEPVVFSLVNPGAVLIDCPAGCPTGWQYLNYKCYKKFNTTGTYAQAKAGCLAQSAQLASISSFDENDALRKAFDTNALVTESGESWIGLQKASGSWSWADGSSVSYTNWAPTQPGTDSCVQMITDALTYKTYLYQRGGWKTYSCSDTSASYICERWAAA